MKLRDILLTLKPTKFSKVTNLTFNKIIIDAEIDGKKNQMIKFSRPSNKVHIEGKYKCISEEISRFTKETIDKKKGEDLYYVYEDLAKGREGRICTIKAKKFLIF